MDVAVQTAQQPTPVQASVLISSPQKAKYCRVCCRVLAAHSAQLTDPTASRGEHWTPYMMATAAGAGAMGDGESGGGGACGCGGTAGGGGCCGDEGGRFGGGRSGGGGVGGCGGADGGTETMKIEKSVDSTPLV